MGVLQRFERRLGGFVEGAFARVFKGAVEPVEVVSALQREAGDHKRVMGAGRMIVPNSYVVELSPSDHENFLSYGGQLNGEIARSVREEIAEQGWSTFGQISVTLERHDDLATGVFRVGSTVDGGSPTPAGRDGERAAARLEAAHGTDYPLRLGANVVGRAEDAQVRLPDVGASRRHAQIDVDGEGASLTDLGSTNGTQVNDRTVVARQDLRDGDRVQVGSTVLVFRMDG